MESDDEGEEEKEETKEPSISHLYPGLTVNSTRFRDSVSAKANIVVKQGNARLSSYLRGNWKKIKQTMETKFEDAVMARAVRRNFKNEMHLRESEI